MVRTQETIDIIDGVQEHWQSNGLFNNFTIEEAVIFNQWVESQRAIAEIVALREGG